MKALIFSVLSALILSACGGSSGGSSSPTGPSYTGVTAPVAIESEATAESVGVKTAEATQEVISQQAAQDANPFGASITTLDSSLNQTLINLARSVAENSVNLPLGVTFNATQVDPSLCGGTISIDDNLWDNIQSDPVNVLLNGTITLTNVCTIDPTLGTITINGTLRFTETATSMSIQFINFTVTDGSINQTFNMTISCDDTTGCSILSDYQGDDGKVYRVADMSISGSGTGPYFFSADFYHPDLGMSSITTTDGIYFNCSNGQPSAGTIQYTGDNGSSGSITFNSDCTTYDGTWDNSTSAVPPAPTGGTYSGSWL